MRRIAVSLALAFLLIFDSLSAAAQRWITEPTSDSSDQRWTIYGNAAIEPGDAIRDPHSEIPICKDRRESSGERSSFLIGQALEANIFDSLKPLATSGGYLSGSVVARLQAEVSKFREQVATDPSKKQAATSGEDLATFLDQVGVSRRYSACGTITLILPPGAREIGAPTYAVSDDNKKYVDCASNGQSSGSALCSAANIGFWEYHESTSSAYVFVVKNWSPNHTRHVRVSMLFTPPLNYAPPEDSVTGEQNSTLGK